MLNYSGFWFAASGIRHIQEQRGRLKFSLPRVVAASLLIKKDLRFFAV